MARCLHTSLSTQDHFPEPTQKETEMHVSNPSAVETDRRISGAHCQSDETTRRLHVNEKSCLNHQGGQYLRRVPTISLCALRVCLSCAPMKPNTHTRVYRNSYIQVQKDTHVYRNSYTQVEKDKEWSMSHYLSNL